MQLDCDYLPMGISRKKKTILSGCFLHKRRNMMMHCQFQTAVFEKVMTITTTMKIPSAIHSSYTTKVGLKQHILLAATTFLSDFLNAGNVQS